MDIKQAVHKAGLAKLDLGPGFVCVVKDGVISLPDNEEDRTKHPSRTVIVLSNDLLCADLATPLITVAPTSHQLKWKNKAEVVIRKSDANGLDHDSRVMLAHL